MLRCGALDWRRDAPAWTAHRSTTAGRRRATGQICCILLTLAPQSRLNAGYRLIWLLRIPY